MRIGIDARFLTHPQRGGFKSYTKTVVTALAEVDRENEYILYTDRKSDPLRLPPNFRIEVAESPHAIVREQIVLPRMMLRDRIDIAHFPCNTAPIVRPPGMVVTVHDAIPFRSAGKMDMKRRFMRRYWRWVMPRAASVSRLNVTNSEFALEDIIRTLNLKREKFRVVHLAVDKAFNSAAAGKRPDALDAGSQFIISFAAMDGRKNHPTTIKAFGELRREFPKLKLALVCSHPRMSEQLRAQGEARVLPLDPVSLDELVWLYRNARALVFPSLDEGFGLPPLEALSCGTPVIASNCGSIPEVLGDAAVFVEPGDFKGIAESLRRILTLRDLRDRMRAKGFARAEAFSCERMGRGLADVYSEAHGRSIPRKYSF